MADGSGDDGGGIRQRAALGPSGLTPLKAKRPAAEQPTDEGAERAAGDEPAPSSDSTIVMAIDEDAGAIAGSGTAPAAAAPAVHAGGCCCLGGFFWSEFNHFRHNGGAHACWRCVTLRCGCVGSS